MNVDSAKTQLGRVFENMVDSNDLAGFLHLDPQNFERLVQLVEDHDPFWLYRHVRDPRYSLGVRAEVAGMMRGPNANRLLLEILAS